ncbi:uncharacterized protein N7482_001395 [Penicillium canariense]|uniref:Uncharacterized protein n=1 Tax=Penicillium canariense TaxID=189055 RepID=A0A9W9LSW9_9EURO|nr:uncharacterized protein N7482_001395 [Penicillium canariense]KAJ5175518.1 hypothetical protein N7482_001395 [Penicillium canariense]
MPFLPFLHLDRRGIWTSGLALAPETPSSPGDAPWSGRAPTALPLVAPSRPVLGVDGDTTVLQLRSCGCMTCVPPSR